MAWIYLDSCLVIDLVERHPHHAPVIVRALSALPDASLAVSPLVKLEVLVAPLRRGDTALIRRFESFLATQVMLPIGAAVFDCALALRPRSALKTPDARHLATARVHGCCTVWTNDDRLTAAAPDLAVNILARTA